MSNLECDSEFVLVYRNGEMHAGHTRIGARTLNRFRYELGSLMRIAESSVKVAFNHGARFANAVRVYYQRNHTR